MAFFRKWKTHYKHKKFTSDDVVDGEDWGLGKPVNEVPNLKDMKLSINSITADDEINDDDCNEEELFASYDIKYLGCTPIETKRSEKVTSEAIKTVIANAKAGGRKNKTLKRVKLIVSHNGLEILDHQTRDTLMRFNIYKISYCSVDAANDHTFSFVASEKDPLSEQEKMSCHVFQCPKRKIAHEITLMVARCFENAYQHWRDTVIQHAKSQGINHTTDGDNIDLKKLLSHNNNDSGNGLIKLQAEVHQHGNDKNEVIGNGKQKSENLLIDLAAADSDVRKFLQNTHSWVSFEDEARDGVRIAAY